MLLLQYEGEEEIERSGNEEGAEVGLVNVAMCDFVCDCVSV